MTDLDAIRRTITLYGQLLDSGRYAEWGALFAEDAEFTSFPGSHLPGGADTAWSVRGRKEIVLQVGNVQDGLRKEGGSLHFGGQPIIDVAGEQAEAWWDYIVLYIRPEGIKTAHAGRYYAQLIKEGGIWCFQRRVSIRAGAAWPGWAKQSPGC